MESPFKEYFIATTIVVIAVTVAEIAFMDGWLQLILVAVNMTCCYPVAVTGLYYYFEGRGERFINGVDWSSMSREEIRGFLSGFGLLFMLGSIVLMYSIAILVPHMVIGLSLMVIAILMMLIPLALKKRLMRRRFIERSNGQKFIVFMMITVIAVVPTVYLINSEYAGNDVSVEFGETGFSVKAPMFDHSFKYDEVEDLVYDEDFKKGHRVAGYSTPTIQSGTYKNGALGEYELASYTDVKPCIVFKYNGDYYAFNQSSVKETENVYETLKGKMGL
ncbi:MAG: hypothetical protein E7Z64_03050 [Thermoplasmata archaeon]|nr:hypothetical protein [Thermoplasmata archaeon]